MFHLGFQWRVPQVCHHTCFSVAIPRPRTNLPANSLFFMSMPNYLWFRARVYHPSSPLVWGQGLTTPAPSLWIDPAQTLAFAKGQPYWHAELVSMGWLCRLAVCGGKVPSQDKKTLLGSCLLLRWQGPVQGAPHGLAWRKSIFRVTRECFKIDETNLAICFLFKRQAVGVSGPWMTWQKSLVLKGRRYCTAEGRVCNARDRKEEKWVMCAGPKAAGWQSGISAPSPGSTWTSLETNSYPKGNHKNHSNLVDAGICTEIESSCRAGETGVGSSPRAGDECGTFSSCWQADWDCLLALLTP